jgi:predicted TIM-barrel fold metal-dependent hydrolase
LKSVERTDFDRQIWEEELDDFVPERVFDAHTHLWSEAHRGALSGPPTGLRMEVDLARLRAWSEQIYPGRQVAFLVLGTPLPGMDVSGHNDWLAAEIAQDPTSVASMIATPDMNPDELAARLDTGAFAGLKPYRSFAPDMSAARITDFLPEALIDVVNSRGLAVTLHLSMRAGPAAPENLRDLADLTRRYPRVQWIMAHCARGFNARHLERALPILRDLPNLWYDTSAVNDLYSHYLLLKHEDRSRVLYGSDNIVAGSVHGIYATYGHAWYFHPGEQQLEHCNPTATLVVYEQLRQQRRAAEMLGLTSGEVQALFWGNAQRLLANLNLKKEMT